jgi:hypothetical protein
VRKLEYTGQVKDGKLHIRNRAQFDREVSQFTNCEIWITVEKKRSKRSIMQNRYYFGVCVSLIQERFKELGTDCNKEDVHCFLRGKFLFNEVLNDVTGEVFQIPRSTTDLSKSEFSEYISKIQQFAAETLDVIIPDANEQLEIV